MTTYQLEHGRYEEQNCRTCQQPFGVLTGFVYSDGDAFALYFATLYNNHEGAVGPEVYLAIGVGDFGEESAEDDRTALTLRVRPEGDQITMQVLDTVQSPWANSRVLGRMLDREDGLASPLLPTFFDVADEIVQHDTVIPRFLERA